jgi:hypothetical protein
LNRAAAVLLVAFGAASACSADSGGSRTHGSASVWKETTVPFDPDCKGCEEIGTTTIAHMGDFKIMRDSRVDDPDAQWSHCVNSVLDCIEQRKDESECVSSSKCPGPCKEDYDAHLRALGRSDVDAKWSAIKAVFASPTSRCSLPGGAASGVTP